MFGGPNALIVAEAERSGPVTNLTIPKFCITEITDQARFNNDGVLANRPFCKWADDFEEELALEGPRFQQYFGKNRMVGEQSSTLVSSHQSSRRQPSQRAKPLST